MATFPADILLQVKAKGVQQQLTKVENFVKRIDDRAARLASRLEKLRIPDQTFARVAKKTQEINKLSERANSLVAQRTARLKGQSSLTNNLVALEKKRRDLVRERLRDEAQVTGELKRQQRFLAGKSNQYMSPIGPSKPKGGRGGSGGFGVGSSIGFPLLFGGGIGSIAGGVAGALLGGFDKAILGSGLGAQFDAFTEKAITLSDALDGAGNSTEALEQLIGSLDKETSARIQNLEESGQLAVAADVAFKQLAKTIGEENARALDRFGEGSKNLRDDFARLATILAAVSIRVGEFAIQLGKLFNDPVGLVLSGFKPPSGGPSAENTDEFNNRTTDLQADLKIQQLITAGKKEQAALNERDLAVQKILRDLNDDKLDGDQASLKISIEDEKLTQRLADLDKQRADSAERRRREQQRAREAEQRELERQNRERERAARELDQRQKKFNAAAVSLIDVSVKARELDKGRIAAIDRELQFIERKQGFIEQSIILSEKDLQTQQLLLDVSRQKMRNKERELELERARIQLAQQSQLESISRSGEDFRRGITNEGAGIALGLQDPFGTSQQVQEQVLALEQMERRTAALLPLQRERNDLIKEGIKLEGLESQEARDNRSAQINALDAEINKNAQALQGLEQLELAQSRYNQVLQAAQPYAEAFATGLTQGLRDVVAGTKTAEEAFADFLNNIADLLIQTAATMIAQYIAIGIAKAFAGLGSSTAAGAGAAAKQVGSNAGSIVNSVIGARPYAEGGYVTGPTPALVGEGGEPEYIIPASKMNGAMARYSAGTRGEAVIDGDGSSASGGSEASGAVIDVNYSVERINSVEYVTNAEFQRGMTAAAKQGAELGRKQVYGDLINKRSVRSRLSI